MLGLPLRQGELRLLGEQRGHRAWIIAGGEQDLLELENVVALVTGAE